MGVQAAHAAAAGDHAEEARLLEEVYTQVFAFMCRNAELKRQRTELELRVRAFERDLTAARAAQERETEAKLRLFEGRRLAERNYQEAERRYQHLLAGIVEIADDYRLSVSELANSVAASPEDESIPMSEEYTYRLRRMVQAPLERIEDVLSVQDISVQHAESNAEIDVRRFDVAGTIDDAERAPGTVVRAHRPAYVGQDGSVIRKGAVIVTRHDAPVATDSDSALA